MRGRKLVVSLLLLSGTGALADDPVKVGKPTSIQDPNKVRCKNVEVTGSLIATNRVCHTQAEWEALRTQARDQVSHMQGRSFGGPGN